MTTPAITFNPMPTTNALGGFSVLSDGLYQGTALDSPNSRFNLAGGILASSETVPMWGGVGLYENIPGTPGVNPLGGTVGRAADYAHLIGFSVFDQAYAGLTTPQSPVPLYGSGQTINFYRLGSGARVILQIDPALATLEGGLITQQVSWDFTNQKIVAFSSTALNVKILQIQTTNCKTVSYDSGTGFATWATNGACAICLI